ncbi:MAG: hypothetical protein U9R06_00210 [Patescibacteria group bacterium]|nr:hypothetical protein [Patescibacteria group bacterium]
MNTALAATTVAISPANIKMQIDSDFIVPINITGAIDLQKFYLELNFDNTLIDFQGADIGAFMQTNCSSYYIHGSELEPGLLYIGAGRDITCAGENGNGNLVNLNFTALNNTGINSLDFSNSYIYDSTNATSTADWQTDQVEVANDITNPVVSITSPTDQANYDFQNATATLSISGTASDNCNLDYLTWENTSNSQSGTTTGTNSWEALVALATGSNNIIITAYDTAGNTATDTIMITYSLPVPTPAITNISANNITETEATIIWTTDVPATAQIDYGQSENYTEQSEINNNLTTKRSAKFFGLTDKRAALRAGRANHAGFRAIFRLIIGTNHFCCRISAKLLFEFFAIFFPHALAFLRGRAPLIAGRNQTAMLVFTAAD